MTKCLRKSCSFGLPRVPFVNCCQFMYLAISLWVLRSGCGIWLYQFLIIAYLFTFHQMDHNLFLVDISRLLVKHLRQVSKQSNQWSRRRCNNKIVTVLSKGQFRILKMVAVRPYLLTDQNHFRSDTSRHWEKFKGKVSTKCLHWFRRRCDKGENLRWVPSARFVDRPESFSNGLNDHLRK